MEKIKRLTRTECLVEEHERQGLRIKRDRYYALEPYDAKRLVSREEVTKAVRRFREGGGLPVRLPDQLVPVDARVGGFEHSAYESVVSPHLLEAPVGM